ncbi:hypothetical protein TRFO_28836 [Tritrichomonas foetus]|uniref:Leucine Rich Repeat family protein n=1 Tax=Tritrichomonas foetus TaxID=1144522 RepID=A0A1J4K2I1_9EUKA|nr:hypothetical protein TRFO_28836 [Tritrichomonas foetus]|eukprot:OHT03701.1 hypothetical protein TRFO_28836 [Tritrichomonas foetus]
MEKDLKFNEYEIPLRFGFDALNEATVYHSSTDQLKIPPNINYKMIIFSNHPTFSYNEKFLKSSQCSEVKWIIINDCQIRSLFQIDTTHNTEISFSSLIGLDLSNNKISDIDSISHIINETIAPKLQYLDLSGNPISVKKIQLLKREILKLNPSLSVINRRLVYPSDYNVICQTKEDQNKYGKYQLRCALKTTSFSNNYAYLDNFEFLLTYKITTLDLSNHGLFYFDFNLFPKAIFIDISNNPLKIIKRKSNLQNLLFLSMNNTMVSDKKIDKILKAINHNCYFLFRDRNINFKQKFDNSFRMLRSNDLNGSFPDSTNINQQNSNIDSLLQVSSINVINNEILNTSNYHVSLMRDFSYNSKYPILDFNEFIESFYYYGVIDSNNIISMVFPFFCPLKDHFNGYPDKKNIIFLDTEGEDHRFRMDTIILSKFLRNKTIDGFEISKNLRILKLGTFGQKTKPKKSNLENKDLENKNNIDYLNDAIPLSPNIYLTYSLITLLNLNKCEIDTETFKVISNNCVNLITLYIQDNRITDLSCLVRTSMYKLKVLDFGKFYENESQKIQIKQQLEYLRNLKSLTKLFIENYCDYDTVFRLLRNLKYFNGHLNLMPPTPAQKFAFHASQKHKESNGNEYKYENYNYMTLMTDFHSNSEVDYWQKILPIKEVVTTEENSSEINQKIIKEFPHVKSIGYRGEKPEKKSDYELMNLKSNSKNNSKRKTSSISMNDEKNHEIIDNTGIWIEMFGIFFDILPQTQVFSIYYRNATTVISKNASPFVMLFLHFFMLMEFKVERFFKKFNFKVITKFTQLEFLVLTTIIPFIFVSIRDWRISRSKFVNLSNTGIIQQIIFLFVLIVAGFGFLSAFLVLDYYYFDHSWNYFAYGFQFLIYIVCIMILYLIYRNHIYKTVEKNKLADALMETKLFKEKLAFSVLIVFEIPMVSYALFLVRTYPWSFLAFTAIILYSFMFFYILINVLFGGVSRSFEEIQIQKRFEDSFKNAYYKGSFWENLKLYLKKDKTFDSNYHEYVRNNRTPSQVIYADFGYHFTRRYKEIFDLLVRVLISIITNLPWPNIQSWLTFALSIVVFLYYLIVRPYYDKIQNIGYIISSAGNALMGLAEVTDFVQVLIKYIGVILSFSGIAFPTLYNKLSNLNLSNPFSNCCKDKKVELEPTDSLSLDIVLPLLSKCE